MTQVLVPLAEGCEELEAVTIIDLLRRADIEVITVSLTDELTLTASRQTRLVADYLLDEVINCEFDMVILPGG
jgi:4-methyl-5(b-hydroxyethyl)-thiazole monophosphate biosynthesis